MKIVIVAGAIITLLGIAEAIAPQFFTFLPLAGSQIAQMGVIFGSAFALISIFNALGGRDGNK